MNMNPASLLAELERLDVKVLLAGDKLRLEAAAGLLTDDLRELIRQHKGEIIAELLRRGQLRRKVIPFPYPINETLGIGDFDPMDVRYIDGKPVLEPGWWKDIKSRKGETP